MFKNNNKGKRIIKNKVDSIIFNVFRFIWKSSKTFFLKKNNLDNYNNINNNNNDNRILTLKGKEHLYILNAIIL